MDKDRFRQWASKINWSESVTTPKVSIEDALNDFFRETVGEKGTVVKFVTPASKHRERMAKIALFKEISLEVEPKPLKFYRKVACL